MAFIRRKWNAKEAEEWTREDVLTIILSPLAYVALMVGTALSLLLQPIGFLVLGLGILITVMMFWVIHPKLSTISTEYEKKQKEYLKELENIVKWEDTK